MDSNPREYNKMPESVATESDLLMTMPTITVRRPQPTSHGQKQTIYEMGDDSDKLDFDMDLHDSDKDSSSIEEDLNNYNMASHRRKSNTLKKTEIDSPSKSPKPTSKVSFEPKIEENIK
jgi:hypothetical protein